MAAFHAELASFVSYFDKLANDKSAAAQAAPSFQSLRFQTLPAIKEAYGAQSEQYTTALRSVQAAIQVSESDACYVGFTITGRSSRSTQIP